VRIVNRTAGITTNSPVNGPSRLAVDQQFDLAFQDVTDLVARCVCRPAHARSTVAMTASRP
jgi:hypothetical protein